MWLLRTSNGELRNFSSPSDVPEGGYAILSHVWQEREMSFQELHALRATAEPASGSSPGSESHTGNTATARSRASSKIRECCILAESHGYKWLWIDTCCIDQSSSAELSEAVNSMFAWYSHAQVCYAYLHDVPAGEEGEDGLARHGSPFRRSRWFTRGWTLQELIAPRSLVFLSREWAVLGTKASLAPLLEQISGVDADVLTFRRPVADVSVARRMWWASNRATTRIEDGAYSLMGLFDVHMPTIYGEGARAFRRLQEEILKRTSDQTLFAWGNTLPMHATPFRERLSYSNYHTDSHLFAPSPASFRSSAHMVPLPLFDAFKHAVKLLGIPPAALDAKKSSHPSPKGNSPHKYSIHLPDFSITSHGARSRMLVIESQVGYSVLAIAALACRDESTGSSVGLLLRRRRQKESSFKHPRYHVGVTVRGAADWSRLRYRLAQADWAPHILSFGHTPITAEWKQLYISHRASSRQRQPTTAANSTKTPAAFRFYCPRWLEVELRKQGFESDVPLPTARAEAHRLGDGGPVARFTLTHRGTGELFRILVGQCGGSPWATASTSPAPFDSKLGLPSALPSPPQQNSSLWMNLPMSSTSFDCARNSVSSWPDGSRTFGDASRSVQLTFTRANDGGATHLLDIRLGGSVYRRLTQPQEIGRRRRSATVHALGRSLVRLAGRR
ncbi:heterokaryon incompatibility protein-domain-containing protein [Fomes fomentarius]|nr:heterokaryon incompatibility protein-domain-containing protein [Fomes fomentarius]